LREQKALDAIDVAYPLGDQRLALAAKAALAVFRHLLALARRPMLLDHLEEPTAIRTQFGAIFVSLELSRKTWVIPHGIFVLGRWPKAGWGMARRRWQRTLCKARR
jgi:hypothetical protein